MIKTKHTYAYTHPLPVFIKYYTSKILIMNATKIIPGNYDSPNDGNVLVAVIYCSAVISLCMLGICCYCRCPNSKIVPRPMYISKPHAMV